MVGGTAVRQGRGDAVEAVAADALVVLADSVGALVTELGVLVASAVGAEVVGSALGAAVAGSERLAAWSRQPAVPTGPSPAKAMVRNRARRARMHLRISSLELIPASLLLA